MIDHVPSAPLIPPAEFSVTHSVRSRPILQGSGGLGCRLGSARHVRIGAMGNIVRAVPGGQRTVLGRRAHSITCEWERRLPCPAVSFLGAGGHLMGGVE